MRSATSLFLVATIFSLALNGCGPSLPPADTPVALTPTSVPSTPTPVPPTLTPVPQGSTIIVTSTSDSGPGTLSQALLDARSGDIITFDPIVFPPTSPANISLTHCLPPISQGNLTIDASNVGVVLDGGKIGDEWCSGLTILSSWNTVRGLRFEGFAPGAGIELNAGAQHNLIGGDPKIGRGLLGQGNMVGCGDLGLNISGEGTSFNTISGNFIGTDPSGADLGKTGTGIWISDSATDNTIGPGNTIAHNHTFGIEIVDAETVGNTITQNSIHGNARGGISLQGISLRPGGNAGLLAPFITGFDLAAGTVTGQTCVNCEVEFFSDENDQGRIYEGRAKADSTGNFSYSRGAPFTGPYLTATATDADGNTSAFSDPTTGLSLHVVLQEGNDLPRTRIRPRLSVDLEDNHLGQQFTVRCESQSEGEAASYFSAVNNLGLKWARLSVDWFDWPEVELTGNYSDYEIGGCERKAIELLHENGIQILYTLVYWDPEIETYAGYTRFRTQEEIERFLDYARFIISNFEGEIEWYGILNEPNAAGDDQRHVLVDDYINLVRQVVPVIRELDPQGKIVIGDVTPLNELGSYEYLMQILRTDDVMSAVDGIAWHGSSGLSLEYQPDYYNSYPTWVNEIVETARAHGFQGQFFAQELHWRTPETPQYIHGRPWFYSNAVSAKYYARGIVSHLGRGMIVGIGHEGWEGIPEVMRVVHTLTTLLAGTAPAELRVSIESTATNVYYYTFALPDGTHLVALWRDGIAVDNDPGVPATLSFPGFSTQEVVGIDVLHGFEQGMITETEGGNLVIRDLLVKDYPIFLRLAR